MLMGSTEGSHPDITRDLGQVVVKVFLHDQRGIRFMFYFDFKMYQIIKKKCNGPPDPFSDLCFHMYLYLVRHLKADSRG